MKTANSTKQATGEVSSSRLIDARIAALDDWRGETLARVRKIIKQADPEVVEEVKWRKPSNGMLGFAEHGGIIAPARRTNHVKRPSPRAALGSGRLFNSSLDGNVRRAIDIRENDRLDGR
jgi:hypothetical protein